MTGKPFLSFHVCDSHNRELSLVGSPVTWFTELCHDAPHRDSLARATGYTLAFVFVCHRLRLCESLVLSMHKDLAIHS